MKNTELETIARTLARYAYRLDKGAGETLAEIWHLLESWGIDPDDFAPEVVEEEEAERDGVRRDSDPTPPHGIQRPDLGGALLGVEEGDTPSPFGFALED